ncbi:MAG: tRNA epoxyqueuosine(34) reductase QueG [Clostridia bacterium]|nr:tRNA epoxyqueuosine(34) reductase QueG [Clostridia bacterium]
MSLYKKLQKFSEKENIISGVGSADSFTELKEYLKNREVPFVSYGIEERTEPALTMTNVKSIVSIGMSYNTIYTKIRDNSIRGNISAGAVGTDYHILIKDKLEKLRTEILPEYEVKIFSDTGPLSDRDVALRCGLGSRSKNGGILNKKIGGMFFIGYMLTNVEYSLWQAEKAETVNCGECEKCIKACPNSAINNGICDYNKCISYLTQKKGALTFEEYNKIGRQIYGCDVCQRACPYNSSYTVIESEYAYPDIKKLLKMSNKEFKKVYGNTAAGWRGKKTLQRNALAVLGNMKCIEALPLISEFINNENEELKSAAIYAINKIKES